MTLSEGEFKEIETKLEELLVTYDNLNKDSQVARDLQMLFGFENIIDWYYGMFFGRLLGHAEEAAERIKKKPLNDEEISQVIDIAKSFGPDIKETITKLKLA